MFSQEIFAGWPRWGWHIIANHLWQATLFSLVVLIASWLMRRGPARARYAIWLIASAKFALPFALFVFIANSVGIETAPHFARSIQGSPKVQALSPVLSPIAVPTLYLPAAEPVFHPAEKAAAGIMTTPPHFDPYSALTLIWLIGGLAVLGRWLKQRRRLLLALNAGECVETGREWEALKRVLSWRGLQRNVRLIISPEITEPGIWGVFSPTVVVPEGLSEQLTEAELEALLMHEIVHVERWDNLVSNIQMALCCVLWFHPFVWLIDRRLLAEREQACDEKVVRIGGASEIYASSITKICRFCLGWKVTGLSSAAGSNLRRRIERIRAGEISVKLSATHRLLMGVMVSGLLILSIAPVLLNSNRVIARINDKAEERITNLGAKNREESAISEIIEGDARGVKSLDPLPVEASRQSNRGLPTPRFIAQIVVHPEPTDKTPPPTPAQAAKDSPKVFALKAPHEEPAMAHSIDLRKYAGRYAVDPSVMENFIFDVMANGGELWIKPSHSARRRLIPLSEVEFTDAKSPDIRIKFNWDETGHVSSLTLDDGGRTITALKLVLPQPSLAGNTVFRLKGNRDARIVAVAGTFNGWNQSQYLFVREGEEWVCRINLPPGKYEYKFIVDGDWLTDPENPNTELDERGNENSVLLTE